MRDYKIVIRKRALKKLQKLQPKIIDRFEALIDKLTHYGPFLSDLPNYSKICRNHYHCHLDYYHVACCKWYRGEIEIEVYYVGNREKALY